MEPTPVVLDSVQFDELVALAEACAFWLASIALASGMLVGLKTWSIFLDSKKEKHPL